MCMFVKSNEEENVEIKLSVIKFEIELFSLRWNILIKENIYYPSLTLSLSLSCYSTVFRNKYCRGI